MICYRSGVRIRSNVEDPCALWLAHLNRFKSNTLDEKRRKSKCNLGVYGLFVAQGPRHALSL